MADVPPTKPRIWCGLNDNLPDGYDKVGNRFECMKKGVGVGIYVIPPEKRERLLANRNIPTLRGEEISDIAWRLGVVTNNKSNQQLLEEISDKLEEMSAMIN